MEPSEQGLNVPSESSSQSESEENPIVRLNGFNDLEKDNIS